MTHRVHPPRLRSRGRWRACRRWRNSKRLTAIPERRVVYRGVDWAFYDRLVDSLPESSNIHVDYDGKDLEVMGKGRPHGKVGGLFGQFVETGGAGARNRLFEPRRHHLETASSSREDWKPIGAITSCPKRWRRMRRPWSGVPQHRRLSQSRPGDRSGYFAAPSRSRVVFMPRFG